MYPDPGFVILTPTILPLRTEAVPILVILTSPRDEVATETLTVVCMPLLYPDPLFPIAIAVIVPDVETIAVPPAETSG